MLRKIIIFLLLLLLISSTASAFNFNKLIWFSSIETDRMQSINIYDKHPNEGHDIYEINPVVRDLSTKEYFAYNQSAKYGIWKLRDYKLAYYVILANQLYVIAKNDIVLQNNNMARKFAISYGFEF